MSLSFEYKYTAINDEEAQADVKVLASDGSVIASKSVLLPACEAMTSQTIEIPSYPFGKKCAKVYVRFRSTKDDMQPTIDIPTGDALHENGYNGLNNKLPANNYKAVALGSELVLDNVKFGYDINQTAISAPRKTTKR